ncbi:GNAT family N-acetyltransferase [Staphylococcus felis]|uniref:GNAT family N-acetyltransferase n=1 Tax=Staphylococcus felis TaxID=46127 RepID=A0ABS0QR96_9STAP|nr:GNAT family N-acetyltransferase [Staphylococcus felis]
MYQFYDATEDIEGYEELLSPKQRGDKYFEVLESNQLIGYFVIGNSVPGIIDYGLDMKPDLNGKGNGSSFIEKTLKYIVKNYKVNKITLSVAKFNECAMKCYEKLEVIK